MVSSLMIKLPQKERNRLARLALHYGSSLSEFSRRILKAVASDIPEESFADYKNPEELQSSFARALKDWRAGRISTRL